MSTRPIIKTRYGAVIGRKLNSEVTAYYGMPYAAPPTQKNRWQPPQPPTPWNEPLGCHELGPRFPQPIPSGLAAHIWPAQTESEDCLHCNLWVPNKIENNCPVLVWIHGGGFLGGSAAWPDGTSFARHGIIVVSINYRLNALGFLHLNDVFEGFGETSTGNLGILDQLFALQWVQDNIDSFGGDPSKVTIMGESAGAISVATLLGTPDIANLCRNAVVQSGSTQVRAPNSATLVTEAFCHHAGVPLGDSDALFALSNDQIRDATTLLLMNSAELTKRLFIHEPTSAEMMFTPVIDNQLISEFTLDSLNKGTAEDINLLIGVNADEWRLVMYGSGLEVASQTPLPDSDRFHTLTGLDLDDLLQHYGALYPTKDTRALVCEIISDLYFTIPSVRIADAQAKNANVFFYRFDWQTPVMNGLLGACHGLELPFVFDQLENCRNLIGSELPQSLAELMHGCWISFVKNGHPGTPDGQAWPKYEAHNRSVMQLPNHTCLLRDPFNRQMNLWPGL